MAMTTPTSYDWLKEYLGDTEHDAAAFAELLGMHAFEIEDVRSVGTDTVIDVDILPNRSSDCLSHRGIAREIATLTRIPLKNDPFTEDVTLEPKTDAVSVSIDDARACRRFGAALVRGVTVGESPQWLKDRLVAIGARPINNIVDATNYVMFSLGQPLHAYDADLFPKKDGVWQFGVRFAHPDERIVTLSNEELELDESVQLIVNASNDTPVGVAGIKGGKSAEINEKTTTVILEAANFDPVVTRKAVQKLRLPTDASKRFENEVSRDVVPYALKSCVALLTEIAGGTCEGYIDEYPTTHENQSVSVTLKHINALLGLSLTKPEVEDILSRLGFAFAGTDDVFTVTAPFYRSDITIAEDVIEEVGRVFGYQHIAATRPETAALPEVNARHYYSERIRDILTSEGFSEVITSSFRKKDQVRLKNALASDKEYLRSSLQENIIEALDKNMPNADLLGLSDIRIFEIGTVFEKENSSVNEHMSVALGVRQKQQGYTPKDDTLLTEIKAKLETALGASIDGDIRQGVFECNLTELVKRLGTPQAYAPFVKQADVQYAPFSTYPFVSRDIAMWTENMSEDEVRAVLSEFGGVLLVRTTLFDRFEKDGRISYAFRLVFQSSEKTLTDDTVNAIMKKITKAVEERGCEVR